MKRLVPLVLVACSTRSAPDVPIAQPVAAKAAREPALLAAHGAAIELLAVTDDGHAAVSQDANGGTRLWPTLDGAREPIVVGVPPATQLAIGREDTGFVIAARDEGGGMTIVRIAQDGSVMSRASIAPEPVIDAIAIAPQGVLAMRADQTLAIYSVTGAFTVRLDAAPRTRMLHLVTRGGHAAVVSAHDDAMNARWLDGAAWGDTTSDFMIDPRTRAMLSPDGTRLLIDFDQASYLLDARSGGIIENYGVSAPVGFIDDDTVIVMKNGKLVWQQVGGAYGSERVEAEEVVEPIAVAASLVVSAKAASLALHARDRVQQLGYAVGDVPDMHVLDNRIVVAGPRQQAAVLDASLEQRAALALPDDSRMLADVVPVDDRFVLATHAFRDGSWWVMSVVDLERQETHQAMQHALVRGVIRFEPSTGLLEISDRMTSYLVQWKRATHSFDTWFTLAGGAADVRLLDPAANDGLVAISLRRSDGGKLEIGEIDGGDLRVGAAIEPHRHYFVAGFAVDVDRRGTVYVDDRGTFVGYHHGVEVLRIADGRSAVLAAHPHGTYIALLGEQVLRLYDASGALRWQTAAPLAQRIAWLGDDLVVEYAGGLGKIDAATGALIKRACGWSFGLSALSSNDPPLLRSLGNDLLAGDSICDAP